MLLKQSLKLVDSANLGVRGAGYIRDQHETLRAGRDLLLNFGQLSRERFEKPVSCLGGVEFTSSELDLKEDKTSCLCFPFEESDNAIAAAVWLTHRKALEGRECLKEQALAQLLEALIVELFILV